MNVKQKEKLRSFLQLFFLLFVFVAVSFIVRKNLSFFEGFIDYSLLGVLIFIFLDILSIVLAPITSLPLIPLMSSLFGWFFTWVISVFSWTIGALIAFYLARSYGAPLISRLISLKSLRKLEKQIPQENEFWTILFLRIIIPVDILSYALGLFSKVSFTKYALATFIGVMPVTLVLSYAGSVSFKVQLILFGLFCLFIFIVLMIKEISKERKMLKKS